jgi:hypothetical protein
VFSDWSTMGQIEKKVLERVGSAQCHYQYQCLRTQKSSEKIRGDGSGDGPLSLVSGLLSGLSS